MRTGYLRIVSVHRDPRWQNSAVRDVTAAALPANNILFSTAANHRTPMISYLPEPITDQ
jgi:hypothetical protein